MTRARNKHKLHTIRKSKVFVGVSGGVDSSVALYLLKQAGYDVTAVFIRSWQPEGYPCTLTDDRNDAIRIAAHLEVPFQTIDLADVYKHDVVDAFIREYQAGRTPNPDILCNREVKFGAFLAYAKKEGALIATGHYAGTDGIHLHEALDTNKDQTYFLYRLTQNDLAHVLFPLEKLTKSGVRQIAHRAHLHTAPKEESQGLCFVGELPMKEFLKPYLPQEPGEVVWEDGKSAGTHMGAYFYTIGERIKAEGGKAYIAHIDHTHNRVYVAHEPPQLHKGNTVILSNTSWVTEPPEDGIYHARFRHRGEKVPVHLSSKENGSTLTLQENTGTPPAPGQSAVIYQSGICLGGGIVEGHARVSLDSKG